MTTNGATKTRAKRPLTIYDCSPEQQAECDYKYLARVWFFRTLVIVVTSSVGVAGSLLWKTAEWKSQQENKLMQHDTEIYSIKVTYDTRLKRLENIKTDIDSLKSWSRPNK